MRDADTLFGPLDGDEPTVRTPSDDSSDAPDQGLADVLAWFRGKKHLQERFGSALRQSIDEVLDGQRTGRFDIDDNNVTKTEKTYLGTKVEIVVRDTFELPLGKDMDYQVSGHDVDAKFSLSSAWNIPTEAMGHLCLLMMANDHKRVFDVGIARIKPRILNAGRNKDGKKTISSTGKQSIAWLVRSGPLPRNILLSLPASTTNRIMNAGRGQLRINELLRSVQGELIDRNTAVTVARQKDGLKRCRDARRDLRADGIAVLGHRKESRRIATALGLPVPPEGSFLAVRLVSERNPVDGQPVVTINNRLYTIARQEDPTEPTPPIDY